ncbi:MAG: GNAT family N-acetyltransferase [Flavobacteriales bacterium]
MFSVTGYGIKLKRLSIEDIELVRYWRNSESIRKFMEYREEITPEMQLKWFTSIDNQSNFFFLISVDHKYIGLINGANTDWNEGITNSGGIFIWDEKFWATEIPFNTSVLLSDISFVFGLKKIKAKILSDNLRSIDFNKKLGFVKLPEQENLYNQLYELTPDNFRNATKPIREILEKRYGKGIHFEFSSQRTPSDQFILDKLESQSVKSDQVTWNVK